MTLSLCYWFPFLGTVSCWKKHVGVGYSFCHLECNVVIFLDEKIWSTSLFWNRCRIHHELFFLAKSRNALSHRCCLRDIVVFNFFIPVNHKFWFLDLMHTHTKGHLLFCFLPVHSAVVYYKTWCIIVNLWFTLQLMKKISFLKQINGPDPNFKDICFSGAGRYFYFLLGALIF